MSQRLAKSHGALGCHPDIRRHRHLRDGGSVSTTRRTLPDPARPQMTIVGRTLCGLVEVPDRPFRIGYESEANSIDGRQPIGVPTEVAYLRARSEAKRVGKEGCLGGELRRAGVEDDRVGKTPNLEDPDGRGDDR